MRHHRHQHQPTDLSRAMSAVLAAIVLLLLQFMCMYLGVVYATQ